MAALEKQPGGVVIDAPEGWYSGWESTVESVQEFTDVVAELSKQNHDRSLVWRGASNSNWALISSLFRNLTTEDAMGKRTFPSETDMQKKEVMILEMATSRWRLNKEDPHVVMAQLQHLGAPTRFIDVTKNPLVALWFACEAGRVPPQDGRIFGFGTKSSEGDHSPKRFSEGKSLHWIDRDSNDGWGKNAEVEVWFPPMGTHPRVFAQNAGFIYGGLPAGGAGSNSSYLKSTSGTGTRVYWKKNEVEQATSLHFNPTTREGKARADSQKTPGWTIKIPAKQKSAIKEALEKDFGLDQAMLFPGLEGLAVSLKEGSLWSSK